MQGWNLLMFACRYRHPYSCIESMINCEFYIWLSQPSKFSAFLYAHQYILHGIGHRECPSCCPWRLLKVLLGHQDRLDVDNVMRNPRT